MFVCVSKSVCVCERERVSEGQFWISLSMFWKYYKSELLNKLMTSALDEKMIGL